MNHGVKGQASGPLLWVCSVHGHQGTSGEDILRCVSRASFTRKNWEGDNLVIKIFGATRREGNPGAILKNEYH